MVGAGRDDGIEEFCRAEFARLVGFASVMLGDRAAAEDVAQETLARAWRDWPRVRSLDRPDLWARRVALNLARSAERRRRTAARAFPVNAASAPVEGPAGPSFHEMIAGLTPRQRAALVCRFLEDLSVADTATVLGCREGTVRALTSQALGALRDGGVLRETVPDD